MSNTSDPKTVVSQRLDTFISEQMRDTADMGREAGIVVDAAAAALQGGKRLRARFCFAGWRAVTPELTPHAIAPENVVCAAASLEIFHAAALVHDDIIDNSDTRRGRPAAHRALESHHREANWHGDSDAFGRASAILLGDLLVAWSDDLLEEGLRKTALSIAQTARSEYARMRRDVTVGQFLDIAEESAFLTAPDTEHAERALRVASLKSARYSIQQPLLLGAALGAASSPQTQALSDFGHPIGMAFQLRDDVLGVFGDESVTGKPSGDDLREGKRTVLVAYTREALSPDARAEFDELIGDPTLDQQQIIALQGTITATGALERTEDLIATYVREAEEALRGAELERSAVEELRELARAATTRAA